MNNERLKRILDTKSKKKLKYNREKDFERKKKLYLEIQILDLREKIERLKTS